MRISSIKVQYTLTGLTFFMAIIWYLSQPGFEPIVTAIGAIIAWISLGGEADRNQQLPIIQPLRKYSGLVPLFLGLILFLLSASVIDWSFTKQAYQLYDMISETNILLSVIAGLMAGYGAMIDCNYKLTYRDNFIKILVEVVIAVFFSLFACLIVVILGFFVILFSEISATIIQSLMQSKVASKIIHDVMLLTTGVLLLSCWSAWCFLEFRQNKNLPIRVFIAPYFAGAILCGSIHEIGLFLFAPILIVLCSRLLVVVHSVVNSWTDTGLAVGIIFGVMIGAVIGGGVGVSVGFFAGVGSGLAAASVLDGWLWPVLDALFNSDKKGTS